MANKKLVILTGVLAVGAAAALLVDRRGSVASDKRIGKTLIEDAQVSKVDKIEIKKGPVSLTLVRDGDGVWHIGDAQGFAADASRVVRLLDDLGRAKLTSVVGSKKEDLAGLGLDIPTVLTLTAQSNVVTPFQFGDQRKGGGQYVALGDETKAYLVDQAVTASPDADQWEMKTIVDVDKALIRSVSFTPAAALGKKPVALQREKKEDALAVVNPGKGEIKEKPDVKSADTLLNRITFETRVDAGNEEAKTALLGASTAVVTLFDGRVYEVKVGSLGKDTKKYYLTAKASVDSNSSDAKAKAEVDALGKMMAAHVYEVPQYVASRFEKGLGDYVEDEAGKASTGAAKTKKKG